MTPIATLTLNPAIDISSDAEEVRPTEKTRTFDEKMEAGGGGINVARMVAELGMDVCAIYLAGGATGGALTEMLGRTTIERQCIEIEGDTRMSLAVREQKTGIEYRFVPEGPEVREGEWKEALERCTAADCHYFVASGSLPRGVPNDFYARLSRALHKSGRRFILDTSGAELAAAVEEGGIFLLKPSDRELREFAGDYSLEDSGLASAAAEIVESGKAQYVAVTMGRNGAIFVGKGFAWHLDSLPVETRSALGSGDSFVGAAAYAFESGMEPADAFRLGVAAGAAAASAKGTRLCRASDVRRLFDEVPRPDPVAA